MTGLPVLLSSNNNNSSISFEIWTDLSGFPFSSPIHIGWFPVAAKRREEVDVVEGGVQNGGAACVASVSGDKVVRRKAAGKWYSLHGAEAIALDEALELVKERDWKEVVICTDSQALVKRLGSRPIEKAQRWTG